MIFGMTCGVLGQRAAGPAAFEVASVKPYQRPDPTKPFMTQTECPGGATFVSRAPMTMVIEWAYDVKYFYLLVGLPDWADSNSDSAELYEIQAKPSAPVSQEQCKLMVRGLLAERFNFAAHRETRQFNAYALTVAKNGPKLREARSNLTEGDKGGTGVVLNDFELRQSGAPGQETPKGWSMEQVASFLKGVHALDDRFVVDKTGLNGRYQFSLSFDTTRAGTGDRPNIFTAVQEQLGLKLESSKEPIEVLIIEHISRPAAN
jgi:uncharacterized protein (TIGR03435 family)